MMNNYKIWQDKYEKPDAYHYYSGGVRWQFSLIERVLQKVSEPVTNVLDIGCGAGVKTELLASVFPDADVLGVDFSDRGIQTAKENRKRPNLSFRCENVEQMDADQGYDLVCCLQVLEHIEDWEKILTKISALSNKYVLITVPTGRMRKYEVYDGHFRNYKKGEIESFMNRHGFRKVECYYAGFPFYSPIERDVMSLLYKNHDDSTKEFSYTGFTKLVHDMIFFLYRYCTFTKIGDQFVGLFRKETQS